MYDDETLKFEIKCKMQGLLKNVSTLNKSACMM